MGVLARPSAALRPGRDARLSTCNLGFHSGKHHTVTVLGIERLHVNGDFERMSSTA